MRSKSFISSRSNDFNGQFKELNNNEMINLRGGDSVPPPKPDGDFPINPLRIGLITANYTSLQLLPVLIA